MEIDLSKKHQVEHFYYEIDGWATIEDQGNLLTQVELIILENSMMRRNVHHNYSLLVPFSFSIKE